MRVWSLLARMHASASPGMQAKIGHQLGWVPFTEVLYTLPVSFVAAIDSHRDHACLPGCIQYSHSICSNPAVLQVAVSVEQLDHACDVWNESKTRGLCPSRQAAFARLLCTQCTHGSTASRLTC